MVSLKKSFITLTLVLVMAPFALAQIAPVEITVTATRTSLAPVVSSITDTSAQVSISPALLGGALSADEMKLGYFEYGETHQACIMIYPTPESCLPKKTQVGSTTVALLNLKPGTSYMVTYKRDNTIRCITTPCPENDFETPSTEFVTTGNGPDTTSTSSPSTPTIVFSRSLSIGSRGDDVTELQQILADTGFFHVSPTGYFGPLTKQALMDFQKQHVIPAVGIVGPLTRAHLNEWHIAPVTETFEGAITAYSTSCFADGICSVTVDGKTIVTTRGWSQEVVGKVIGIPDFGSIAQKIGAHAKVYARKTEDGYTLYGSESYYIDVQ